MVTLYSERMKALVENHSMREIKVCINKFLFINSEVVLSPSLEIRGIKPNSPAIHYLLIGDKIVSINGQLVNDPAEALYLVQKTPRVQKSSPDSDFQEFQIEFSVYRQLNKVPVNRLRLAHAFKQSPRSLSHPVGFHYFVVTLRRIRGIHLGFKVKMHRGKLTVTEVQRMREILRKSMHRYGSCTTLMERVLPEPIENKPNNTLLHNEIKVDPVMAKDVASIGEREAYKFSSSRDRHFLRPVLLSREDWDELRMSFSQESADRKPSKGLFNAVLGRATTPPGGEPVARTAKAMKNKKGFVSRKPSDKKVSATPLLKKLAQKAFGRPPTSVEDLEEKTAIDEPQKPTDSPVAKGARRSTARAKHGGAQVKTVARTARDKHGGAHVTKDINANIVDRVAVTQAGTAEAIRVGYAREKNNLGPNLNNNADAVINNQRRGGGTPPRRSKRRTLISPRHGEQEISTDVQDPKVLHKVKDSGSKKAHRKKAKSPKTSSSSKKTAPRPATPPAALPPLD